RLMAFDQLALGPIVITDDRLTTMRHQSGPCCAAVLVVLAIAMLISAQPIGVLWHVAHDHLEHSDALPGAVTVHVENADIADHDADHGHVWTIPAAAVVGPCLSEPQAIAALTPLEDLSQPAPALFPPFSPPRA